LILRVYSKSFWTNVILISIGPIQAPLYMKLKQNDFLRTVRAKLTPNTKNRKHYDLRMFETFFGVRDLRSWWRWRFKSSSGLWHRGSSVELWNYTASQPRRIRFEFFSTDL